MSAEDIGRAVGELWGGTSKFAKLIFFGGTAVLLSTCFGLTRVGTAPPEAPVPVVVIAPDPIPQTEEEIAAIEKQAEIDRKAQIRSAAAEAKALAKIKKKEGVSIGMSTADAIASNWGNPRKINTTTNVYGTSEQWVYDGGYLYFKNGILTSIQN